MIHRISRRQENGVVNRANSTSTSQQLREWKYKCKYYQWGSFITGLPKETMDQEKRNISNEIDIEESEAEHQLQDDEDSETSDSPDHVETVDEEEKVETTDNKKNGPFRLSEEHRQIVERTFNGMKKERMWRLSTGKYVEKELFELGKKLEFEHVVHSFIVDVDDVIIRQHFNMTELDEIDNAPGPQEPELSDEIVEFLNKFFHKTRLNDIRKIIKEMIFDDNYDHEKDHDKDYIIYALYSLVREIQSESLKDVNLEAWFNCHVWNSIFDQAFGDLKAISVVRGESSSLASASRKNSKRKSGERRKMGHRGDWILRSVSNGVKDEFGAGEAGKIWVDKNGTKILKEKGLKLPKTLKDMLIKLMDKVDWDVKRCLEIQTVGMIHA
ncbi:706_t:CDS:2, partial [Funneliformis geosporum]